jgi:hypothetical protein
MEENIDVIKHVFGHEIMHTFALITAEEKEDDNT